MSKYHLFLDEATENTFLQKIREESEPLRCAYSTCSPEGSSQEDDESEDDSDSDVMDGEDEDIEEKEFETIAPSHKKPKKFLRRNSKSLEALIKKYDPTLECSSDTNCLLEYTNRNIKFLQLNYGQNRDDLTEWVQQLGKLAQIIYTMYSSNTDTLRGAFVNFTGLFKTFYYNDHYDEVDKNMIKGPHIWAMKEVFHAEKAVVKAHQDIRAQRQNERLRDKYHEDYDETILKVLKWDKVGNDSKLKKDSILLLLSSMACMGCRKTAILDPNVEFYTYKEYQEKLKRDGLYQRQMRLGVWKDATTPDKEFSFLIDDKNAYEKLFGSFANVIVQVGVLKDANQSMNKYLTDKNDKRLMPNKVVIKPTIILDAQTVVDNIKKFRSIHDITKENFVSRKKSGAKVSTRNIKPFMIEYFPAAYALSESHRWEFGCHYLRKFYANSSYLVYKDQMKALTGKYIDRSIWASCVLAHSGSLQTSLSYMNLDVSFGFNPEVFAIPDKELLRNMFNMITELKRENEAFKKEIKDQVRTIVLEGPKDENVALFTVKGKNVSVRKVRKYKDVDTDIRESIKALKQAGVPHSSNNIMDMGFGRPPIQEFTRKFPEEMKMSLWLMLPKGRLVERSDAHDEIDEKHFEEDDVKDSVVAPAPKKAKTMPANVPSHPLPEGTKVIVPKHKKAASHAEAIKRDQKRFGPDNVLLEDKDCEGTIEKNVLLAKKLTRDLCKE